MTEPALKAPAPATRALSHPSKGAISAFYVTDATTPGVYPVGTL